MEVLAEKYSDEFIKDIELRYPGPYYVYLIQAYNYGKDKGVGPYVGCTNDIDRRLFAHRKKIMSLPVVLLETTSVLKAAEKERESKEEYGIPHNYTDYVNDLNRVRFAVKPDVLKRRAATQSKNKKGHQPKRLMTKQARAKAGRKASERQKGKIPVHMLTPEARAKAAKAHWKPVIAYKVTTAYKNRKKYLTSKEFYKKFDAIRFVTEELGINGAQLNSIVNGKPSCISAKGKNGSLYTFEFAN